MNPFGMGMPNMGGGMGGMPMNQFGMGMGMPNMGVAGGMPNMQGMMNDEDEWMKGFQMGVQEVNNPGGNFDDSNAPGPKLNIIFTTTIGTQRILKFKYGTTISQAIKKYLESVGKSELFGQNDKVNFLFNANKIEFNDNTKVEDKFRNIQLPKIVVNDTQGLIGA